MEKLICKQIDGTVREYYVKTEKHSDGSVWVEVGTDSFGAGRLELALAEEGELLWVKYIERPYTEPFVARGVAEATLLYCVNKFGKNLISTPSQTKCGEYGRSEAATKMWRRLENKKLAKYEERIDRFVTTIAIGS
ncbi:hypothetical protein ACM65P_004344 [Vibrio alginolyticus]